MNTFLVLTVGQRSHCCNPGNSSLCGRNLEEVVGQNASATSGGTLTLVRDLARTATASRARRSLTMQASAALAQGRGAVHTACGEHRRQPLESVWSMIDLRTIRRETLLITCRSITYFDVGKAGAA